MCCCYSILWEKRNVYAYIYKKWLLLLYKYIILLRNWLHTWASRRIISRINIQCYRFVEKTKKRRVYISHLFGILSVNDAAFWRLFFWKTRTTDQIDCTTEWEWEEKKSGESTQKTGQSSKITMIMKCRMNGMWKIYWRMRALFERLNAQKAEWERIKKATPKEKWGEITYRYNNDNHNDNNNNTNSNTA